MDIILLQISLRCFFLCLKFCLEQGPAEDCKLRLFPRFSRKYSKFSIPKILMIAMQANHCEFGAKATWRWVKIFGYKATAGSARPPLVVGFHSFAAGLPGCQVSLAKHPGPSFGIETNKSHILSPMTWEDSPNNYRHPSIGLNYAPGPQVPQTLKRNAQRCATRF